MVGCGQCRIEALAFRVFPNLILPAHQEWAVQVSGIGPEGVILSIVDAVGRIIEQKKYFRRMVNRL